MALKRIWYCCSGSHGCCCNIGDIKQAIRGGCGFNTMEEALSEIGNCSEFEDGTRIYKVIETTHNGKSFYQKVKNE